MSDFPSLCQNFQVKFTYSLHFTKGVFNPENPLLAQTAAGFEKDLPKKLLLLVDDGLLAHHPKIIQPGKKLLLSPSPKDYTGPRPITPSRRGRRKK